MSSIKCENELKQNMGTEQDILLWNIMKMKFVFSHFTFPSAYLGPHFIIVTVAWNCVTALTMALGVNILLHFTLVIGLSFSFLLQKQEKICPFSLCPHFYFILLFKNNLEWRYVKCVAVWIFQLLTSFEKLLFKATLPFTRFRAEDRLRFHSPFRQWARVVCCLEVTVSVKWTFFFRRDILLERTETSAEKPGGFAKWYEWKLLRQIRTAHNLFVRMFMNSEVVSDKTCSVQQHKRERAAWR